MSARSIKCPQCASRIEIEALLSQQIESELVERLQAENEKSIDAAVKQATSKAELASKTALADLSNQLKEQQERAAKAEKQELEFRKQARLLKDKEQSLDLEIERRLDESKEKLELTLKEQFNKANDLELKKRDREIEKLNQAVEDAYRKGQQGSQESQGEVLEDDLQERLERAFPVDRLDEVKKGKAGADILHTVVNAENQPCGVLIWEAKNTKNWQPKWISKLKDDQREAKASIAILVSVALPPEIEYFGQVDGVWVCSLAAALPLATVLREQITLVDYARNASAGKGDKMDLMYSYFSGDEFRQKVEGIVEAFTAMQTQLNKEKAAMQRIWNERDKQIQRVIANTTGMYGDVRGIIGSAVGEVRALELDSVLIGEDQS